MTRQSVSLRSDPFLRLTNDGTSAEQIPGISGTALPDSPSSFIRNRGGAIDRHFADGIDHDFITPAYWRFSVNAVLVQPDGQILLGGRFQQTKDDWVNLVIRLHNQPHNRFFGNWLYANQVSSENDGSTGDPGGRGIPNLLRYAFGLDPMHPTRAGLPRMHWYAFENKEYLALTFPRRRWAQDIDYAVEWSPDLIHWEPLGIEYMISTVKTISGWEEILLRSPQPLEEKQRQFLRMRVTHR